MIETPFNIEPQKSKFSPRIFFFVAVGLVVIVLSIGILFSWYYFPNLATHPSIIKYRSSVNNGIDFFLASLPKKLLGKPISYWWAKQVVVEDQMDNIFVYSLAARIVDVDSSEYTVTVEDFAGQLLEFPLEGEILDNGTFSFPVFELPLNSENWQRTGYTSRAGDNTLEDVFCTGELVSLIWADERPLSFWTRFDGYFNKDKLSDAPHVTVHIFKQIYPFGKKQTSC